LTHPRYLADLSLISIILGTPANRFVVESTEIMLIAIDYRSTAAEGGQNHYRCYDGQKSLCAHDSEPPIEPLNSAAKTGLEAMLLLWNVDIYLCNEDV
jgi:hypothetical protein